MDKRAWFRSDDMGSRFSREAESDLTVLPGIAWLTARLEYALPLEDDEPVHGIGWLLFGVGAEGAGWLGRLSRSAWFSGLEPQRDDVTSASSILCGNWTMSADVGLKDEFGLAAEAEAFFATLPMPQGWCAAVAVPRGIKSAETAAVLGLVNALRGRRDPLGRRLTVVVTIEDKAGPFGDVLVRRLRGQGAFVICGGNGMAGDHLHHFPLRATVRPRHGRLICVDLPEFLQTWRPGWVGELQTVPDDFDVIFEVPGCALNILFHLDLNAPGPTLDEVERRASKLCEQLLASGGDVVVTTAEWLDGRTRSVDLLVIQGATERHAEQPPVP